MRIGYVQTRPRIGRVKENVEDAIGIISALDADLVVLPELFNTGYALTSGELEYMAETAVGGPTISRLLELAESRDMAIVAGFAERDGGDYYNSAVLATPGGIRVHRKVHLFGKEKRLFRAGDSFDVHCFKGVRIGMMVCFDWFFPESCRTLMLKGAEVIAHPANLVLPFWPKASLTRAVENRVFIATAGRVGKERGLHFIGCSLVVSPEGRFLAKAGRSRTEHAVVEIDPAAARDKHVTRMNDLVRDRRPDAYRLDHPVGRGEE